MKTRIRTIIFLSIIGISASSLQAFGDYLSYDPTSGSSSSGGTAKPGADSTYQYEKYVPVTKEELEEVPVENRNTDTAPTQKSQPRFDRATINEYKKIDMSDPVEVQLGFVMCGLSGFQGSDCRKVLKFCIKQKILWKEALSKKPWLCEDGRFIKEFF
tara:strand:- start:83 stop:556 length:474 start_codon:yes stop_codon:yes gene_type:complete